MWDAGATCSTGSVRSAAGRPKSTYHLVRSENALPEGRQGEWSCAIGLGVICDTPDFQENIFLPYPAKLAARPRARDRRTPGAPRSARSGRRGSRAPWRGRAPARTPDVRPPVPFHSSVGPGGRRHLTRRPLAGHHHFTEKSGSGRHLGEALQLAAEPYPGLGAVAVDFRLRLHPAPVIQRTGA